MKPPRRQNAKKEKEGCGRQYPLIHLSIYPTIALLLLAGSVSAQTLPDDREAPGFGTAAFSSLADYPLPAHILLFSDTLHLTEEQIKQVEAISDLMNVKAQALGISIIAKEERLQELLLSGEKSEKETGALSAAIVTLRDDLRSVNRTANVQASKVLTRAQRALYNIVRHDNRNTMSGMPLRPEGTR